MPLLAAREAGTETTDFTAKVFTTSRASNESVLIRENPW